MNRADSLSDHWKNAIRRKNKRLRGNEDLFLNLRRPPQSCQFVLHSAEAVTSGNNGALLRNGPKGDLRYMTAGIAIRGLTIRPQKGVL